ncbi:MAG: C45 family autoproteolytic acyltransferase/hydrolase [Acidobacteriota bacterium]
MKLNGFSVFLIPGLLLSEAAFAQAGVDLENPGFESTAPAGVIAAWSVEPQLPAGQVRATVATDVRHGGLASVRLTNPEPDSLTLVSEPVVLQVGRLYRLGGWVKTEKAFADPTLRYPTAVSATLTMASFPFTNHAPVVGGTRDWSKVEVLFFATQRQDRVRLHLGLNGKASGEAWFDDLSIQEVTDISEYIPPDTVKWFGPAFRYTDRGWTFVHIEGKPYPRGFQYGHLLAKEIAAYIEKLSVRQNTENPKAGWQELRTLTDALMLRKYDREYLEEMKGIADGAAGAGASFSGRPVDFLDIVTVNSVVDLGQLGEGLNRTAHPLSGLSFQSEDEESKAWERTHKCSSFLANGPATKDGRIVFSQLFMWNGYTGVHWDVICDVVPAEGHRLVYETFPGGIHSGADFYLNSAGIMIGETTVMQTPFNSDGAPQSSRIRKAAQYAGSIDDAVRILTEQNNGLYTNDWLIGDLRTNEIAILLLGTKKHRLWRSRSGEFPGGTDGFYWSVNNAKDPEVRKEYIPDPANAPFDLTFFPSNRDLAFTAYYKREKGKIDALSAVNAIATSPINRPHACDGKVTTSEMAEHMMFLAHYGKVTLREKFPEKNSRLMPDLPGALPHLTLGYSVINPVFVTEELKRRQAKAEAPRARPAADYFEVRDLYSYDKKSLWSNTVFAATEADNWFVSGTAAYWRMLNAMESELKTAAASLGDQLAVMNCRLLDNQVREGKLAASQVSRVYDRYGHYLVPRLRGTFALHQLRLLLGNSKFAEVMKAVHTEFREKPMTTEAFVARAGAVTQRELGPFIGQWLDRDDLPAPQVKAAAVRSGDGWTVRLSVAQPVPAYDFLTTVGIETEKQVLWRIVHVNAAGAEVSWDLKERPQRVIFNIGNDIPVSRGHYRTLANVFDDFGSLMVVYGTSRQIEAQHTLALRYQTMTADTFTESLPAVRQDAEVSDAELGSADVVFIGVGDDNSALVRAAEKMGATIGRNFFSWEGRVYADPEDGLQAAFVNPWNPSRMVILCVANSALELYQMTKRHQFTAASPVAPSWAVFNGETVVEKGFHPVEGTDVTLR